jgi:hypothetical protein
MNLTPTSLVLHKNLDAPQRQMRPCIHFKCFRRGDMTLCGGAADKEAWLAVREGKY